MAGFKVRSHSHLADSRAPAPNSQGKAGRCKVPVPSAEQRGIWPRPGAARPRTGVGAETGLRGRARVGVGAEPGTEEWAGLGLESGWSLEQGRGEPGPRSRTPLGHTRGPEQGQGLEGSGRSWGPEWGRGRGREPRAGAGPG